MWAIQKGHLFVPKNYAIPKKVVPNVLSDYES